MSALKISVFSFKSTSWLLVLAILLVTLLPAHYHFHHLGSAGMDSHAHVIDLHFATDKTGATHHDEAGSIAASPDGMVKKSNAAFPLLFALAIVLTILPILKTRFIVRPVHKNTGLKQSYPHFTPLLRAPPLH
jgi:hypothetical protein